MTKILESERLETQPAEVSENRHLTKVLQPVDDIANVALHHIRACVQPLTTYESIQRIREVPPALPKISVGDARFRQWWSNRETLRLTERSGEDRVAAGWKKLQEEVGGEWQEVTTLKRAWVEE